MTRSRTRLIVFVVLCAVCALGLGAYFYLTARRTAPGQTAASSRPHQLSASIVRFTPAVTHASDVNRPREVFFRYTGVDADYGRLAVVDYANPSDVRTVGGLSCEVVYYAGGHGICLSANRGMFTTFSALIFDRTFTTVHSIPLHGVPSRSRLSADGLYAGLTVFTGGQASYSSVGFSTQTLLVDAVSGAVLADLESFKVTRDGQPFWSKDFNFWGVTFTPDSQHFFCTLSTNQKHYLVKGDIAAKTATVIHENVECPSLSPDGTRIGYKKRFIENGRVVWQLYVLDLATRQETPLGEKRSVDCQLEWLDNDHVLYSLPESESPATTDIWVADASGRTSPQLFLLKAYSPAVVR